MARNAVGPVWNLLRGYWRIGIGGAGRPAATLNGGAMRGMARMAMAGRIVAMFSVPRGVAAMCER
ncbi:MAG: hypothetical protein ACP5I8_05095 [Phycisphaerae bacterium]